ncbi:type II toxin-antitoxin system HicA family toxin [Marinobacter salarius]
MKSSDIRKKLEKDGWQLVRINGSHHCVFRAIVTTHSV